MRVSKPVPAVFGYSVSLFSCLALLFLLLAFPIACANQDGRADGNDVIADKEKEKSDGRVVGISDGDTFRLLTHEKQTVRVRLHGIDAPEKGQDFGTRAREVLSELIFSKDVRIVQKSKDRYGRVVAIVFVNGHNVNEEMLRSGMVWHYTAYDKNPDWVRLEQAARQKKIGLWQQPNPTPPWQFRKEKRTGQPEENPTF